MKLNQLTKFEENPFIIELKGKMFLQPRANTIVAKGEAIIDKMTGEILKNESMLIGRRKLVDKSKFAKIYASEISILFDLSKTAINVFLYLSKVMEYDNKAYFNYNNEYKKAGYKSDTPPLKGLKELLSKDIIAMSNRPHHYWLNPTIICKGERFAVYTEYIHDKELDKEKEGKEILSEQLEEKERQLRKDEKIRKKIDLAEKQKSLFD